jgi:hypothetical protein
MKSASGMNQDLTVPIKPNFDCLFKSGDFIPGNPTSRMQTTPSQINNQLVMTSDIPNLKGHFVLLMSLVIRRFLISPASMSSFFCSLYGKGLLRTTREENPRI